MTIRRTLAVLCTLLLLFALAAFGIEELEAADPITTSAIPQPDWLYMLFFQVTRYCQGGMEMLGVFWGPLILLLLLAVLPFIDRSSRRGKAVPYFAAALCLALFVGVSFVTYHTSETTPVNSCPACHKEGFGESFAYAPTKISDFSKRYDNKWLALHYRYPQYFWMMDADVPKW